MPTGLTDRAIADAVGNSSTGRRELIDRHEPGLRLRIGPQNSTWCVSTTGPGGQKIRVSIGAWPHLDVGAARNYARAVKASLQPVPASDPERFTVEKLLAIYAKRRLEQLRKGAHMERSIRAALAQRAEARADWRRCRPGDFMIYDAGSPPRPAISYRSTPRSPIAASTTSAPRRPPQLRASTVGARCLPSVETLSSAGRTSSRPP